MLCGCPGRTQEKISGADGQCEAIPIAPDPCAVGLYHGQRNKPLALSVGLFPSVSPELRTFLDNLLRHDDSWALIVPTKMA